MIYSGCIVMPWPDSALSQNKRVHWTKRASATRSARKLASGLAMEAGLHLYHDKSPRLIFSFFPPDNRRRDLSNMPATQKAAIDGISDAMKVDDSQFRCVWPEVFSPILKPARVLIKVVIGEVMRDEIIAFLGWVPTATAFEIAEAHDWNGMLTQTLLHKMDDDGDVIMRSGIYRLSERERLK